jgi:HEPN domain-containing protein
MDKKEHINYWLKSAKHDLKTAESLFKDKRYDWCLFLAHLVLEKTLKALWIRDNGNNIPPKVHNLVKLTESIKINFSEEQKIFLLNINDFNIEARYPDYKFSFYKKCTLKFTRENLNKIKVFYKWLLKQISLNY